MGRITILNSTTVNPISLIGERAGYCWGAKVNDYNKNYKRGLECLKSNHGRTLEFPNIEFLAEGYSARVIREFYTHIGGAPSRLQASTRYINYSEYPYVIPKTVSYDPKALYIFEQANETIQKSVAELEAMGIPREDAGMLLPLCMETTMVDKCNLRHLIDMSHQRLCSRANWEFRELLRDLYKELYEYSPEWSFIIKNYMKPKCKLYGYCTETNSCGKMPKREV